MPRFPTTWERRRHSHLRYPVAYWICRELPYSRHCDRVPAGALGSPPTPNPPPLPLSQHGWLVAVNTLVGAVDAADRQRSRLGRHTKGLVEKCYQLLTSQRAAPIICHCFSPDRPVKMLKSVH